MCANDNQGTEGHQALQRILEDAIDAEADAVELEYVDGGLEICYMIGNTGLGRVLTDDDLIDEII